MPTPPDALLADHARLQYGLVTYDQCREAGLTDRELQRRRERRLLVRVQPRVYRLPGAPDEPAARVMAAILSAGGGAVAAMHTAAHLHGLSRVGALEPVEVCLPQSYKDEMYGVIVHRTRRLEPCDVCSVEGIPATTPARTLIDLAAVTDRRTLTALVDDAMGLGIVNRSWLHRRAGALRKGRRGVGVLLALTGDGGEPAFRSWLERRAAHVLQVAGVPSPAWNEPVHERGRMLGIADACWPEHRLIVEFDGMRFHASPDQRRADAERERNLVLAGWRVLRFTWLDVDQQPQKVAEAIQQALTRGVVSYEP